MIKLYFLQNCFPLFVAYVRGEQMSFSWLVVLCLIIGIIMLIAGVLSEVKNKDSKKNSL